MPTIGTASLATVAGFSVLLLSPVPMVRGFGLVLMGGVLLSFVFALSAGTAALVALGRLPKSRTRVAASVRGAADLVGALTRPFRLIPRLLSPVGRLLRGAGRPVGRLSNGVVRTALRKPGRVLAIGAVLAVAGLALDSQTEVVSDIQQLVPRDTPAVRDILTLQDRTQIAGEIDVLVEAADLTDPKVLTWMRDYQARLARDFHYTTANGCGAADLCPAFSLPDLFRTADASADQSRIRALLAAVPEYFSRAVLTTDHTAASMAFGIKLLPFDRQQQVIETMRKELDPPAGVHAAIAGLPVLAAEANDALADPARRLGTILAGLVLVTLALLLVYRRWERAWLPLVPIAMATGWSGLVLWLTGIPLNPMSATLGALVIAISTEFSILLSARYRQERAKSEDTVQALERAYSSTGAAVLASGATAIAGFAAVVASDIQMLHDFGAVTVIDLTVSLLGVLIVLPAAIVWAEQRGRLRASDLDPRPLARAAWSGLRELPGTVARMRRA
jgi:predicted RND superfamily exporter protein